MKNRDKFPLCRNVGTFLLSSLVIYTSLFNPTGKLLTMAREKVTSNGYLFKKGHSRSKHTSSDSDEPPCKRRKIDTEERAREIKLQKKTTLAEDDNDEDDEQMIEWVACDSCAQWHHNACVEIESISKWTCASCK